MKIKHGTTVVTIGNQKKVIDTEYYEISVFEAEKIANKVKAGGNEKQLREEMIRGLGY